MATETSAKASLNAAGLGPLIRLHTLSIHQLPSHPSLASSRKEGGPGIHAFASSALEEADTFMTTYLPKNFEKKGADKWSAPAKAPVTLLQRDISSGEIPKEKVAGESTGGAETEHWFARESLHENKAEEGTASWEEFDHGLRVDHSQHEMDYTPDVQDAHEVMNWDSELEAHDRKVGEWEDVHASIMEMRHKIPAPLNNRVFPELVITGKKKNAGGRDSFTVVQVPVATQGLPNAKYHNAPKITGGMYCSIEHCELVEEGQKTRWRMATASDAGGVLPMWAQKMGIPGAVVKDVGLFVLWVAERRGKGKV